MYLLGVDGQSMSSVQYATEASAPWCFFASVGDM